MPDRERVLVTHVNSWCSSYLVGAFVSIDTTEPEYEGSCWCQPQIQPDVECDDDDMVTFKLPANLGVLIGAAMILTGATYLILRVILMMQ